MPASLVWIQAVLSVGMILSGSFEQILTVTGFLLGIFPMLAVLGLYTQAANQPQRVPSFTRLIAAPLFIGGSLLILVLSASERPMEMGVSTAILLLIFITRLSLQRYSKTKAA